MKKYVESIKPIYKDGLQEILYFQYQRMMRYGGQWHLERKAILPGCIFLLGSETLIWKHPLIEKKETDNISLKPCETPYLKRLCQDSNLVEMSTGIIKDGLPVVTSGPLKGKEELIRRIDRHKRTAKIGIPFEGREQQVTVGLEIYKKQI